MIRKSRDTTTMQNHRNKIKYPVLAGIALTGLATFYPVSAVSQDDAVPVSVTAARLL